MSYQTSENAYGPPPEKPKVNVQQGAQLRPQGVLYQVDGRLRQCYTIYPFWPLDSDRKGYLCAVCGMSFMGHRSLNPPHPFVPGNIVEYLPNMLAPHHQDMSTIN